MPPKWSSKQKQRKTSRKQKTTQEAEEIFHGNCEGRSQETASKYQCLNRLQEPCFKEKKKKEICHIWYELLERTFLPNSGSLHDSIMTNVYEIMKVYILNAALAQKCSIWIFGELVISLLSAPLLPFLLLSLYLSHSLCYMRVKISHF